MAAARWFGLVMCPVFALTACDAKPKPVARTADRDFIQAQKQSSSATACSALPDNTAIAAAIKTAMADTYGPDEASAQFVVSAAQPQDNCHRLRVAYHLKGTSQSAQTIAAELGDRGHWFLDFYRKRYPID